MRGLASSETLIVTTKWSVRVTEAYVVHAIFLLLFRGDQRADKFRSAKLIVNLGISSTSLCRGKAK